MYNSWLPNGFSELERLGDGSFGRVELIQREEDGSLFALKVLEKQGGIDSAEVEIESLNLIDSPFVANLYKVYRTDNSVALLIDPALGGSLRQKIAEHREKSTPMPKKTIYTILTQILIALSEVHRLQIAHRDLGPANILFVHQNQSPKRSPRSEKAADDIDEQQNGDDLRVLLVDFGVSASVKNGDLKGSVGTPNYMSPELAKGESHNTKTDVYSLGIILYEMCELQLPSKNTDKLEYKYHKEFSELISQMTHKHPQNRPTVPELLQRGDISKYAKKYENSKRISLSAHDWNPVVIEFDDNFEINFEDLPPIDTTIPTGSGRLLVNGNNRHSNRYNEDEDDSIQEAERVAYEQRLKNEQILAERKDEQARISNELKRQERQTQQKWREQKEDLSQHKNDYFQRLGRIKQQKREKNTVKFNSAPIQQQLMQQQQVLQSEQPLDGRDRLADELERTRAILERQIGAEKLLVAHRKLEDDMMLSPAELQITPKEYDAISRLIKREKEVFGSM